MIALRCISRFMDWRFWHIFTVQIIYVFEQAIRYVDFLLPPHSSACSASRQLILRYDVDKASLPKTKTKADFYFGLVCILVVA